MFKEASTRLRVWIVAGVLLLLGVVAPAGAAGSHQVPFKGTMSVAGNPSGGMVSCSSPAGFSTLQTIDLHGIISHLGETSGVETISGCSLDPATGLFVTNGTVVYTAANGDQVSGTFETTVQVLTGEVSFTAESTGGTGRFAGVTGSASGGGTVDLATHAGTVSFSGWMSSVGSSK
jgi:hypothetical protein